MWFYKRTNVAFWIFAFVCGIGGIAALFYLSTIRLLDSHFFIVLGIAVVLAHLPVRLSPLIAFQSAYVLIFFLVYVFGHPIAWAAAILLDMYMIFRDSPARDWRLILFSGARVSLYCVYLLYMGQNYIEMGLGANVIGHLIVFLGLVALISLFNWLSLLVFRTYRLGTYVLTNGLSYDLVRYSMLALFTLLLVITWETSLQTGIYSSFWVIMSLIVAIQILMFAWQASEERTRKIKRMLVGLIDWRDRYADSRSLHNRDLCVNFTRFLKWSPRLVETVNTAALLHDIGKIIVSDSILHKQERLTSTEFDIVKRHVEFAASELEAMSGFKDVARAIRDHHERWDGMGYPAGKKGDEIDIVGRLLMIGDSFMAMVKSRPFRPGMPRDKVLSIIEAELGTQFAPVIGNQFLMFMREGTEPLDYLIFYPARPR